MGVYTIWFVKYALCCHVCTLTNLINIAIKGTGPQIGYLNKNQGNIPIEQHNLIKLITQCGAFLNKG